jgi:hypothetical protein
MSMKSLNPVACFIVFWGGIGLYFSDKVRPKFKMAVVKSELSDTASINIIQTRSPNIRHINTNNTDCLKNKGYDVNLRLPGYIDSHLWYGIGNIKKDGMTGQRLIADCKECQVNTEIIYEYNNILLGNKVQLDRKQLYWHKNFKDELNKYN